jgi:putative cell wall-binding protein
MQNSPLLLVPNTFIPAVVIAELSRLQPARIIVLGGPASVSDAVMAQLAGYVAK